jgi:hypothetical protein
VAAGSNGQVSVFAMNDTDLIIDIDGYFAFPNGGPQSVNHGQTTVTISANQQQTYTVTWAFPFPDTNYTVTCTPQLPGSLNVYFWLFQVSAVNTSSVSVDAAGVGYGNAGVGSFNLTINCIGIHN